MLMVWRGTGDIGERERKGDKNAFNSRRYYVMPEMSYDKGGEFQKLS
jgi:hypothetical protein